MQTSEMTLWFLSIAAAMSQLISTLHANNADSPNPYSDPQLVERAKLIVVAKVKEGSIVYVPLSLVNYEYRAVLLVDEVIKGKTDRQEIPIIIHLGMEPRPEGDTDFERHNYQAASTTNAQDWTKPIKLYQGYRSMDCVSNDIRQSQLWMLRTPREKGTPYKEPEDTDALGLWHPQEIQPGNLAQYYQAFTASRPEAKLRACAATGPSAAAEHAQMYLDRLRMQQIIKEPDVTKRVKLLLPYCYYTEESAGKATHYAALGYLAESCGKPGNVALASIFKDPKYKAMKPAIVACWCSTDADQRLIDIYKDRREQSLHTAILNHWSGSRSHETLPILLERLQEQNQFWAAQPVEVQDSLARNFSSELPTKEQQEHREELTGILSCLQRIPGANAIPVLETTKKFWDDVDARATYNGHHYRYINYRCETALNYNRWNQSR